MKNAFLVPGEALGRSWKPKVGVWWEERSGGSWRRLSQRKVPAVSSQGKPAAAVCVLESAACRAGVHSLPPSQPGVSACGVCGPRLLPRPLE